MDWLFMLVLAAGLSVDTFALSIAVGAQRGARCAIGPQAVAATLALTSIAMFSLGWQVTTIVRTTQLGEFSWLAGAVLIAMGLQMLYASRRGETETLDRQPCYWLLFLAGFVSGIDAAAAGSTLLNTHCDPAAAILALWSTTFALSLAGNTLGQWLTAELRNHAQAAGGVILVGFGGYSLYC